MRFTLLALLALTIITWHQALALPYTPTETAEVERDITTPFNSTELQIVDADEASLGISSRGNTISAPIRRRLLFDLPIATANDMRIMNTEVAWRLHLYYDFTRDVFVYDIDLDGEQTRSEVKICITHVGLPTWGKSNGNTWVQYQLEILVYWMDTISNKLITVAWNAAYQFGQNDPDLTYYMSMVRAPRGWYQSGPKPASGCPKIGVGAGTKVKPTSWSFLPWSAIISNLGS
jgi:hypothetical protein